MRREAWKKMSHEIPRLPLTPFSAAEAEEEIIEERNDVCIYRTLRYPPKSTPPAAS